MKIGPLPPITLMVWEHHLTLLIRAVRAYKPKDQAEEEVRLQVLAQLSGAAGEYE